VGARAVGWLQKSVRGIFPAWSPMPARVAEIASGSTDRPLLVTVEPERFGRQGCWVNERWLKREREVARPGSNVRHLSDGRRPGPTSPTALTRRWGIGSWQSRSMVRRKPERALPVRDEGDPLPALRCDMGRQRSRRPVLLSQPKGAEGWQPPAGAIALRRAAPGRSGPKLLR
jgi:hypothetical protein